MVRALTALLLTATLAGCAGDDPQDYDESADTGDLDVSLIDAFVAETADDTAVAMETSSEDTSTGDSGSETTPSDTSTPTDTGTPMDTGTPTDTATTDTGTDTRPADTGPVMCTSVACVTNTECAVLGCGTCNTGPGRCRAP